FQVPLRHRALHLSGNSAAGESFARLGHGGKDGLAGVLTTPGKEVARGFVGEGSHRLAGERDSADRLVEVGRALVEALRAYTLGWVAYEQSQSMHSFLAQMINFTQSFESGLQA